MMKKDISQFVSVMLIKLIPCSKILVKVLYNMSLKVVTMETYWVSDLPNIKGISGHH